MRDEAVNIDPTFAKGWVRRATALQANGRLKDVRHRMTKLLN